ATALVRRTDAALRGGALHRNPGVVVVVYGKLQNANCQLPIANLHFAFSFGCLLAPLLVNAATRPGLRRSDPLLKKMVVPTENHLPSPSNQRCSSSLACGVMASRMRNSARAVSLLPCCMSIATSRRRAGACVGSSRIAAR